MEGPLVEMVQGLRCTSFCQEIVLEVVKTVIALLALALVGQRVIAHWDIRKKRLELDIAVANQFHQLYGEFKTVWRLWKAFKDNKGIKFPDDTRAELLKRATSAESGVEAITVKLATERSLSETDLETLGLFRQAFQLVREAIRYDQQLNWQYNSPEYLLFNDLASDVARMISFSDKGKSPGREEAKSNFQKVTGIRREDWEGRVKRTKAS
jgi:hypothetical protein